MLLPFARPAGLVVRELPAETLVYDLERNKAHCLNRAAALVWRHCDGQTTAAEMARVLREEFGGSADEAPVRLALEQLSRRHLLEQPLPAEPDRRGRRDALRKLAALGAVPLVITLAARSASNAASVSSSCVVAGFLCVVGILQNGRCVPTGNFQPAGTACGSGGQVCNAQGACGCPPRKTECNGTCTDLSSDPLNCGTCGTVCPTGQTCVVGACIT
ncbi:MAG TPA: PqqD family peptide modification chaperone [Gemmataceae bacterium]|nr:PqqD family peptide modification chaperone [Gemmataceae bacterium]